MTNFRCEETGEATLQLHRSDSNGHTVCAKQETDSIRDISVSPGKVESKIFAPEIQICSIPAKVSIFPRFLPRLEELSSSQSVPQRMFHQAAEGSGEARKRSLLDH